MPAISLKNVAAGTANAVDGLKFRQIPQGGGLVTVYGTTAVAGGSISMSIENQDILASAQLNIEGSADVVDTDRDLILYQQPVPAGEMFVAVENQICNVLIVIE